MNLIKALLLLAIAGGGYQYWQGRAAKADLAAATSASGFVQVPMPEGVSTHGVVVFAPDNCPSEAAQRAYALVSELGGQGVPVVRSSSASFDNLPDAATAARVRAVMQGDIPVVFVNGKAKANPSVHDVLAEYRRKPAG